MKKRMGCDSFHDEDESLAGGFKIDAIAGDTLHFVALAMLSPFSLAILPVARGAR